MPAIFSPALFQFLADLDANNDRAWFEANKDRFERDVKAPSMRFIEGFAAPLREISPHFRAIAKSQGGSMFRIHRDTRFSSDKRPYKNNIGLHFRHEAGKDAHTPGYYLHIQPPNVHSWDGVESGCFAGFGLWMPDPDTLARIRGAIVERPERWTEVKGAMAAAGLPITHDESSLKRPPRGYPEDHPHLDDLRMKSFAVSRPMTEAEILAPDLLDRFAATCKAGSPLVAFLCEAVGQPF